MNPPLGQRIRALFGNEDKLGIELVMTANFFAAASVGVVTGLMLKGTFATICAIAGATFVLLTACLLSRYSVWIAAILGSLTLAVGPAVALGLATESLPGGHWGGGVLGATIGLAAGIKSYWRLASRVSKVPAPQTRGF